jgi:molybdate transport system permease protein
MNPLGPILLSLKVAFLSTAATFVLGIGLALLLARAQSPLRRILEAIVLLPMVFPPTITGYLLLLLLGRRGLLGGLLASMGIETIFTWGAAVIASTVVALPLMYQNSKAAFASVDPAYAKAARTLGMGEARVLLRVTLPLAAPGILAGTALSFARALGEFGATLMVAGNIPGRTQTIPLALYSAVEGGRQGEANILLLVTVLLSFGVVLVVGWCEGRATARTREGGR